MLKYANPTFFLGLAGRLLPWLAGATALTLAIGMWGAFFYAPADYQQGQTVRIMYIHVPSAWLAMFCYATMAASALGTLVWRHPLADAAQKAAAPIGAVFTFVCLVTGSLWGKPMWGTWWVWDARLTSVLLLFLLYLGYIALANAFEDEARGTRAASILALVGAINLPVIKFSVDWWNTLHQPASVSRLDAPALHPSMLLPLLVMALAFMAWFATVLLWRIEAALAERRLAARRMLSEAGTATPTMRR